MLSYSLKKNKISNKNVKFAIAVKYCFIKLVILFFTQVYCCSYFTVSHDINNTENRTLMEKLSYASESSASPWTTYLRQIDRA